MAKTITSPIISALSMVTKHYVYQLLHLMMFVVTFIEVLVMMVCNSKRSYDDNNDCNVIIDDHDNDNDDDDNIFNIFFVIMKMRWRTRHFSCHNNWSAVKVK
jgi:hypothetical protein